MTANWRLKRRVRARAAKTGESYTAALRHLRHAEEAHMPTYEFRHGGVTDVGNVRAANQDQFLTEGVLVVVADGMGGRNRGEIASRLAVETLKEAFAADPTAEGLVEAARAANRAVWEQAEAEPDLQGMGTTIAAAARVTDGGEERLAIVNVGDSRVYLLRQGQFSRLSSDHSLVADLVRAGELSEADARAHPERHVLTSVLGVGPDIDPHVASARLARGDRLLLCSDGLFNELSDDEISATLEAIAEPDAAADQLVRLAKDHGGSDNITAVVVDIA
jgi:serine/threonine protein phosphatase PrpC